MEGFPKMGGISAPPLFIEEVDAKRTEEFVAVGTLYLQELPPPFGVLSPEAGLESALARQTTSKLSVCPRLLADFPL